MFDSSINDFKCLKGSHASSLTPPITKYIRISECVMEVNYHKNHFPQYCQNI